MWNNSTIGRWDVLLVLCYVRGSIVVGYMWTRGVPSWVVETWYCSTRSSWLIRSPGRRCIAIYGVSLSLRSGPAAHYYSYRPREVPVAGYEWFDSRRNGLHLYCQHVPTKVNLPPLYLCHVLVPQQNPPMYDPSAHVP